jgi:hypothetical protein
MRGSESAGDVRCQDERESSSDGDDTSAGK